MKVQKYYGYRSAQASSVVATLPRELCNELENALSGQLKNSLSNHSVVKVLDKNYRVLYIQFTDDHVIIGHSIVEGKW